MNNVEVIRTNMAAVKALKSRYSSFDDETLIDIVETIRPHIENPFRISLMEFIKNK